MLISNIQRFSLHDGPGIRTTVFLMGCNVRCPWCCNPENLEARCREYIQNGQPGIYGREYTPNQVYEELIKDEAYYHGEGALQGGVTFSGGEPLIWSKDIAEVARKLRDRNINTAVETSLFVDGNHVTDLIPYINLYIIDMKIMDDYMCKEIIGGKLEQYIENFDKIMSSDADVIVRIPVIGGYTDTEHNIQKIGEYLCGYGERISKIEMLKGHDLAKDKYKSLSLEEPIYNEVSKDTLERLKEVMKNILGDGVCIEVVNI